MAVSLLCLIGERGFFCLGNFHQTDIALGHLIDHEIPEMVEQIPDQPAQFLAAAGELMQLAQGGLSFALQHGVGEREHLRLRAEAEH